MYSLRDHGNMISDPGRFGAYVKAIAAAVRPGDVVVEIGAGTGVFSLLACRAGARRVFAIESEDIIQYARELAAANGFSDRIEFFESNSRIVELPERANVVVSDIRGCLPLFERAVPSLEDARKRFLVPGGIMIPYRETLKAALVEADDFYRHIVAPWNECASGVDLSPLRLRVLDLGCTTSFTEQQLLTPGQAWGILDYIAGASTRSGAKLELCVTRGGTGHGLCLWFETLLHGTIGFASAPGTPDNVYGQLFLPWLEPVVLQEGESVQVALRADLVGEDYVWQWETTIPASGNRPAVHFRQSNFDGAAYSAQALHRQALDYVPALSQSGQVDLWMLERMNGKTSLQQIAQAAAQQFPQVFASWEEAFRHAAGLSEKMSR
jgi:type I protein arginine methyltransferase